tara:strand:+ start:945 stop:1268 length:324 start_codon:yes stop_codon:yes gene_type:complete
MKISSNIAIILFFIFIYFFFYKKKEHFSENKKSIEDLVKEKLNEVYLTDKESIRNLSLIVEELQKNGLKINGNLNVSGNLTGKTIEDMYNELNKLDNLKNLYQLIQK